MNVGNEVIVMFRQHRYVVVDQLVICSADLKLDNLCFAFIVKVLINNMLLKKKEEM